MTPPPSKFKRRTPNVFQPSAEQAAIFQSLLTTDSHLVVEAGAGCGKTTTLAKAGQKLLDASGYSMKIGVTTFSAAMAAELAHKMPSDVQSMTTHSLGFRLLREYFPDVIVDKEKGERLALETLAKLDPRTFTGDKIYWTAVRQTMKLVELCKAYLVDGSRDDVQEFVENYRMEIKRWVYSKVADAVPLILEKAKEETNFIDFDDQIWLPVIHKIEASRLFDLLMVDEAQDLTPAQWALVFQVSERLVFVGDARQSIFAWRGADAQAMTKTREKLGDTELGVIVAPLKETYRCPKSHVRIANVVEPTLRALEGAGEGWVLWTPTEDELADKVEPRDMVLCRTNAPLCRLLFQLLSQGRSARIQGRDDGKSLISLAKDFAAESIDEFLDLLDAWYEAEREKLVKRTPNKRNARALILLEDRYDCLTSLSEGLSSRTELINRIDAMFSDEGRRDQIVLSSIHRAKGMEADQVWIIRGDKLPHPMARMDWEKEQEMNCLYVAITRAKTTLNFVGVIPAPIEEVVLAELERCQSMQLPWLAQLTGDSRDRVIDVMRGARLHAASLGGKADDLDRIGGKVELYNGACERLEAESLLHFVNMLNGCEHPNDALKSAKKFARQVVADSNVRLLANGVSNPIPDGLVDERLETVWQDVLKLGRKIGSESTCIETLDADRPDDDPMTFGYEPVDGMGDPIEPTSDEFADPLPPSFDADALTLELERAENMFHKSGGTDGLILRDALRRSQDADEISRGKEFLRAKKGIADWALDKRWPTGKGAKTIPLPPEPPGKQNGDGWELREMAERRFPEVALSFSEEIKTGEYLYPLFAKARVAAQQAKSPARKAAMKLDKTLRPEIYPDAADEADELAPAVRANRYGVGG